MGYPNPLRPDQWATQPDPTRPMGYPDPLRPLRLTMGVRPNAGAYAHSTYCDGSKPSNTNDRRILRIFFHYLPVPCAIFWAFSIDFDSAAALPQIRPQIRSAVPATRSIEFAADSGSGIRIRIDPPTPVFGFGIRRGRCPKKSRRPLDFGSGSAAQCRDGRWGNNKAAAAGPASPNSNRFASGAWIRPAVHRSTAGGSGPTLGRTARNFGRRFGFHRISIAAELVDDDYSDRKNQN